MKVRDEKIEQLISYAGNENRYQYLVLGIFFALWMNCNIITVILPFWDKFKDITINKENIEIFTFIGNTLGSIVFTIITYFLNHKAILIFSSLMFSISIGIFTIGYQAEPFFIISICLIGLFGNLLCYSSLVITLEIVSSRKRSLFSGIINSGYAFCGLMYTLIIIYFEIYWKKVFYFLIAISLTLGIIIWLFIYDSPRVFIDKRDFDKTESILKAISIFNRKKEEFSLYQKSEEFKYLFKEIMEYNSNELIEILDIDDNGYDKDNMYQIKERENKIEQNINIFSSLIFPSLRKKFIILCILWFLTRLTSNIIFLLSKPESDNDKLLLFIIESNGYIFSGFLIKFLRKRQALWLQCFIIIIIFILLNFEFSQFKLILTYLLRFFAASIELVYWTYTLEIYPTSIRYCNFGINVTFGNLGTILSPFFCNKLLKKVKFPILIFFSILECILIIHLPETKDNPMVETIEELNKLNRK